MAGQREGGRLPGCLSPAGVLLVAVSLCSGAMLEQVVVGQALVTFSLVFRVILNPRRLRR